MTELARRPSDDLADRTLARWLPGLSESTRTGYSHDVTAWLNWCHDHGANWLHPTGRDLGEHLDGMRHLSVATRARRWSAVNSWYRWLREEGQTDANPEVPKSARPVVRGLNSSRLIGLGASDARALLARAQADGPRSAALVSLLLTCGLRIQEALDVKIQDLQSGRGGQTLLTVIGKGEKSRTVVVPPVTVEACQVIADNRPPADWLFITSTGQRWSQRHARKVTRRLGLAAGITGLHPHALRHTAASLALDSGTGLVAVKGFLGHSGLGTTERYVQAASTIRDTPAYTLAALITPDERETE